MNLLHYLAWSCKTTSGDFRKYNQRTQVDLHAISTNRSSLLHLAAQRANLAVMKNITQTAKTIQDLADLRDSNGRTALHFAAESKRGAKAIPMLLSRGIDIRAKDQHGRSALHHTARLGRLPAVETLAAALFPGMLDELRVSDVWGITPAMVATHHDIYAVAALLKGKWQGRRS